MRKAVQDARHRHSAPDGAHDAIHAVGYVLNLLACRAHGFDALHSKRNIEPSVLQGVFPRAAAKDVVVSRPLRENCGQSIPAYVFHYARRLPGRHEQSAPYAEFFANRGNDFALRGLPRPGSRYSIEAVRHGFRYLVVCGSRLSSTDSACLEEVVPLEPVVPDSLNGGQFGTVHRSPNAFITLLPMTSPRIGGTALPSCMFAVLPTNSYESGKDWTLAASLNVINLS